MQLVYQTCCRKCGLPGHNARTCGRELPSLASELERGERTCSVCSKPGHNARTCQVRMRKNDILSALDRIERNRLQSETQDNRGKAPSTKGKRHMADAKLIGKLYSVARGHDKLVDTAKAALDKAMEDRSAAIQALDAAHPSGTFRDKADGRVRTIRSRPQIQYDENGEVMLDDKGKKIHTGAKTYFFVAQGESEMVDV